MTHDDTRHGDRGEYRPDPGWRVRELVLRLAVEQFGATATEEPVEGFTLLTRTRLDEPLAGVRAARLVADVAAGALREWALAARGAGSSWSDVAAALDLCADGASAAESAEVAWEWLVEHRPPPPLASPAGWGARPASAVWTCTTCRARVRDTGPFASHPDDREHGHTPNCARHAAEIAAWRQEDGWDDEQDDEPDNGDDGHDARGET